MWHVNVNCECMLGDDRKQCLKAKKLSKFGATGRLLSVVISYKPREKSANCRSMTAVSYKLSVLREWIGQLRAQKVWNVGEERSMSAG